MKELENSKKFYDQIEIPEELNEKVLQAIAGAKQNNPNSQKEETNEKGYSEAVDAALSAAEEV